MIKRNITAALDYILFTVSRSLEPLQPNYTPTLKPSLGVGFTSRQLSAVE